MRKRTKAQYFVKMFIFWMGKLGFEKPIDAVKDNRMDCPCCIENWYDPHKICLKYHTRRLGQYSKSYLLNFVFHEIGHLCENLPYDTDEQKVLSERKAEMFSVRMMKKYYPKEYQKMLKRMTERNSLIKMKKDDPLYYKAYLSIADYRNTIK
ncbi:MAG: hypothetical protein ACTSPD_10220 [Promethearchaeota archaeon]